MSASSSAQANKHVELTECRLLSPFMAGRPQIATAFSDISPMVSSIDIYENIFSPVLSGEIVIQDDIGMSSLVPMIGMEFLTLKFSVADASGNLREYGNASPLIFSVYRESDRTPLNQGTQRYSLGLTSPELFTLSESKISRAYPNKQGGPSRTEDIIRDLLTGAGTKKKFEDVETTKSPVNIVIPYLSPLDVIRLLTLQGQSEAATNYAFYETLRGFHFKSIRGMISQGQRGTIPRIVMQLAGLAPSKNDIRNLRADSIEITSGFDFLFQTSQGAFGSVTIGLDVLSGKYRQTVLSYDENVNSSRNLTNGVGSTPMYPMGVSKLVNPTAKMFLVPTLSISAANTSITTKDPSIRDNFFEKTLASRSVELLSLQSRTLRVKTSGIPDLHAGTLVDIVMPTPLNNNKIVGNSMDIASGRYLIIAAKHSIINNGTGQFLYETVFEASSDSYAK